MNKKISSSTPKQPSSGVEDAANKKLNESDLKKTGKMGGISVKQEKVKKPASFQKSENTEKSEAAKAKSELKNRNPVDLNKEIKAFKSNIKEIMGEASKDIDSAGNLPEMKKNFDKAKTPEGKKLGAAILKLFSDNPLEIQEGLVKIAKHKNGLQDLLIAIGGANVKQTEAIIKLAFPEEVKGDDKAVDAKTDDKTEKIGKLRQFFQDIGEIFPANNRAKTLDKIFKGLGKAMSNLLNKKYDGLTPEQIEAKHRQIGKVVAVVIAVVVAIVAIAAIAKAPFVMPALAALSALLLAYNKATGFVDQFEDKGPMKVEVVNQEKAVPEDTLETRSMKLFAESFQKNLKEMMKLADEALSSSRNL